jgi:hypothetical protein
MMRAAACAGLAAAVVACTTEGAAPPPGTPSSTSGPGAGTGGRGTGGTTAGSDPGGSGGLGLGGAWETPPPDYCSICASTTGAPVQHPELLEASGISASIDHAGVYWAVNDSGDSARFFAVGDDGADLGTYDMPGIAADDCEDMAIGPCSVGHCIFVGDIGDNDLVRPYIAIYRVPEPASVGAGSHQALATQLKVSYEDGAHNAETLLVHPTTGETVVITRQGSEGATYVYRIPDDLQPNITAVAPRVGEIAVPQGSPTVTSGSVHPLGHGVLLRTFTHAYFYPLEGPNDSIVAALERAPCPMPVVEEQQGEAIAWTTAGDGYVTLSEGVSQPLNHFACVEP